MPRDPDPVGGDSINRFGSEFASSAVGFWSGVLGFGLAAMLIAADLALGPFFLLAQAESNGVELDLVAKITPWVFSIALTGLLYALWETIGVRYSKVWIKILAIAINVGDTLTDIGGANYLFTRNPEAGQNFWPPADTPPQMIFLIYALGIACFFHEPLLAWLLGMYEDAVDNAAEFGEPGLGEKFEVVLVKFGGVLLNFVKFIGKMGASFMLPALDIILTPLNVDSSNRVLYLAVWASSIGMTAVQTRLWARTREMGGIMETMRRSLFDRMMVIALGGLVIIDTYFDAKGYNQALYGEGGGWLNVISEPTPNWIITIGILVALCSFGELLSREVFTILGRQSATIRKERREQRKMEKEMGGDDGESYDEGEDDEEDDEPPARKGKKGRRHDDDDDEILS